MHFYTRRRFLAAAASATTVPYGFAGATPLAALAPLLACRSGPVPHPVVVARIQTRPIYLATARSLLLQRLCLIFTAQHALTARLFW
ncbi:pectin acetylesterase [Acetobacter orientalis]|uniref:Pectin acetylesterase n=1 Tax=Acetobacter orientalis TaxID=146474 RepID=A0A2Z5ZLU5_9PROT|nr:pectin acetylesterase [Acetobacter orientalis]